jgi:hypothetical protein
VNNHLQLLRDSVMAPGRAVDLAVRHPDTWGLGWRYVTGISVLALLLDLIMRQTFPGNYAGDAASSGSVALLDSPWGVGLMTAFFYGISYVFLRWFWRRVSASSVPQGMIDAAVIVSFACAAVFLVPQSLAFELASQAGKPTQAAVWLIPIFAAVVITSQGFAYGCSMGFKKALLYNVLSGVILFVAFTIIMILGLMLWAGATGRPLEQVFGSTGESAP